MPACVLMPMCHEVAPIEMMLITSPSPRQTLFQARSLIIPLGSV
jgi:hypothetical protein